MTVFARQHLYKSAFAIDPNGDWDFFVLRGKQRHDTLSLVARDLCRRIGGEEDKGCYKN